MNALADALRGADLPMLAAGLGLILLALLGALVLRRRAARATEAVPVDDTAADDLVATTEPAADEAPETDGPVEVVSDLRALRAHVRVLEEALERAAESTVEQPDLASYRAQVRLAVEAVARRTSVDVDPRLAVARVAAAIERLDLAPSARTPLPAARPVPAPVAAPVAAPFAVASDPEPEVQAEVHVEPEPVALEPDAEPDAEPEVTAPAADEVVLPVPPPAPAEPRRTRRRPWRSAA